jgi:cell division transport system permease protein
MKFLQQSLKNSFENFRRNKLVNSLCLVIIAFSLLILGLFNTVSFNLDLYINQISQKIEAIFYIKDNIPARDVEALARTIGESLIVKDTAVISRELAQQRFSREFPQLNYILSEFNSSPFPVSIEVSFKPEARIDTQVAALITDISHNPAIESHQFSFEWALKIQTVKEFINAIGYFLSFILLLVTVFIIYNVIKLNIFYRREEIVIFQLVGATRGYIQTPFLLEGSLLGLLGGILAALLLQLAVHVFPIYAGHIYQMVRQIVSTSQTPPFIFLKLIGIGTLIGLCSAALSLKRYVKGR